MKKILSNLLILGTIVAQPIGSFAMNEWKYSGKQEYKRLNGDLEYLKNFPSEVKIMDDSQLDEILNDYCVQLVNNFVRLLKIYNPKPLDEGEKLILPPSITTSAKSWTYPVTPFTRKCKELQDYYATVPKDRRPPYWAIFDHVRSRRSNLELPGINTRLFCSEQIEKVEYNQTNKSGTCRHLSSQLYSMLRRKNNQVGMAFVLDRPDEKGKEYTHVVCAIPTKTNLYIADPTRLQLMIQTICTSFNFRTPDEFKAKILDGHKLSNWANSLVPQLSEAYRLKDLKLEKLTDLLKIPFDVYNNWNPNGVNMRISEDPADIVDLCGDYGYSTKKNPIATYNIDEYYKHAKKVDRNARENEIDNMISSKYNGGLKHILHS